MAKAKTAAGVQNQRAAALRNSQKATGPRTAQGKLAVSRNALKHGLSASKPPLLTQEDSDRYQELVQGLTAQYEPVGPLEEHLIDQIAMCVFKQRRAWVASAAVQQAALLPSEAVQPLEPKELFTAAQLQELSLLKQIQWHLADCDLDYKDPLPDHSQREEAEEEGWLDTWPPCWEEGVFIQTEHLKDNFGDIQGEYPADVLPYRLPAVSVYPPASDKQIASWVRRRAQTLELLANENHPYGLMEKVLQHITYLTSSWEGEDNPYRQIERVPTAELTVTAEEDAQRILAEWAAIKAADSWGPHRAALNLQQAIFALKDAVEARLAYYQKQIDQDAKDTEIAQERDELLKLDLPERLELVNRYEHQTSSQLDKALNQLLGLQKARLEGQPVTVKLTP